MYDFSRNCDIFLPRRVKKKVKNSQKAGKKPQEDGDKCRSRHHKFSPYHDRLPMFPYLISVYIYIYICRKPNCRETNNLSFPTDED